MHTEIRLDDYRPYPFAFKAVSLTFDIHDDYTLVHAVYDITNLNNSNTLDLNGQDLELIAITLNGDKANHSVAGNILSVQAPETPEFTLNITTKIYPHKNTHLKGLYISGENYCTQCEAEGFRHITYYPDRPDVMSIFTVRIEANAKHPILLSNGNLTEEGALDNDRHFKTWHDPHKKPCYLFALVAGDLEHIHDTFTTKSGNVVDLYLYVRDGDQDQCTHAMDSLKRSMKWDEDVYGLEYDLNIFNIVAVSDFNSGAMENKSLNIFNTALALAHQDTATDTDFQNVESVIAHEYFHNWSGNRVTCRDWFQLSLKEGLTVFRDQEFSADMGSRNTKRIDAVKHLREFQFPEDASPLAHPIRPSHYIEINNFYTMTVYEKGAEVIRMFHTLLGAENYRKATDLYFSKHDGHAATCEDWFDCMQACTDLDLSQFKLWYTQAGTPHVDVTSAYDPATQTYTLTAKQRISDAGDYTDQKPMFIPLAVGLLSKGGQDLIGTQILNLTQEEQSFSFPNIAEEPILSFLRGFSAPVTYSTDQSHDDFAFLARHDNDGFCRWEAVQSLFKADILSTPSALSETVSSLISELLSDSLDDNADHTYIARLLTLPTLTNLYNPEGNNDPEALQKALSKYEALIKRNFKKDFESLYKTLSKQMPAEFDVSAKSIGMRALRNVCLHYLTATNGTGCAKKALEHYQNANCMTDRVAALASLTDNKNEERITAFDDFYQRFKDYPLVIDKWFALQAASKRADTVDHLKQLTKHADFNLRNPNRVRSIYAAFGMRNLSQFHKADGNGYAFLAAAIKELNSTNPQIAARLLTPFKSFKSYDTARQSLMKQHLEDILSLPDLSPDIYEIASKTLNG